MTAARSAAGKLEAAGTKWLRPPDYYAEMVKSDEHMARVKAQLMHEQGEIESAQERCVAKSLKPLRRFWTCIRLHVGRRAVQRAVQLKNGQPLS